MKILKLSLKTVKIMMIIVAILAGVYIIVLGTQMSATYPALKTYDYDVTDMHIYKDLVALSSQDSTLTFVITDSVGPLDDRRYYCKIHKTTGTDSLTFNFFFQSADRLFDSKIKSEVSLTRVWDNIEWKGGYKIENPIVPTLIQIFEDDVINKL